jgi:hypothetical protein
MFIASENFLINSMAERTAQNLLLKKDTPFTEMAYDVIDYYVGQYYEMDVGLVRMGEVISSMNIDVFDPLHLIVISSIYLFMKKLVNYIRPINSSEKLNCDKIGPGKYKQLPLAV